MYLYYSHDDYCLIYLSTRSVGDDGWLMKLYYNDWSSIEKLLNKVLSVMKNPEEIIQKLHYGKEAFWISNGKVELERKTFDIDQILNKRI